MKFFAELKRRNVYKVAVAYAVIGWLLVQVTTQVFPVFEIPNWALRLIVLAIIIGFPIALVLAWAFELTPEGIKRTEDVDLLRRCGTAKITRGFTSLIVGADALDRSVFSRSLHSSEQDNASTERDGDSFDDPAKIDRGVAIRKSE